MQSSDECRCIRAQLVDQKIKIVLWYLRSPMLRQPTRRLSHFSSGGRIATFIVNHLPNSVENPQRTFSVAYQLQSLFFCFCHGRISLRLLAFGEGDSRRPVVAIVAPETEEFQRRDCAPYIARLGKMFEHLRARGFSPSGFASFFDDYAV